MWCSLSYFIYITCKDFSVTLVQGHIPWGGGNCTLTAVDDISLLESFPCGIHTKAFVFRDRARCLHWCGLCLSLTGYLHPGYLWSEIPLLLECLRQGEPGSHQCFPNTSLLSLSLFWSHNLLCLYSKCLLSALVLTPLLEPHTVSRKVAVSRMSHLASGRVSAFVLPFSSCWGETGLSNKMCSELQ